MGCWQEWSAHRNGDHPEAGERPNCEVMRVRFGSVTESFGVVDCDAGKFWRFSEESTAVRYAAARHAATGAVVEVARSTDEGAVQHLVLPPNAPLARP